MEITFKYCCGDAFKKIYSPFIKSLKKQFGKKGFEQLSIVACELETERGYSCGKCSGKSGISKRRSRKYIIPIHVMRIIVRKPNE